MVRTHKDLEVWKVAVGFVTEVYKVTKGFPQSELFGLTNQMRRAAVSVPSNIAEGAARNTSKEFVYYLSISLGSLAELETQLMIAKNLGYINETKLSELLERLQAIRRMVLGLRRALKVRGER
ncbi:MAG: four helix bundle protein [Bacteroidia bacterium]|jgi:four helix bundle protein|nr:four helix bundle protein [Bacteroidia bacterium]